MTQEYIKFPDSQREPHPHTRPRRARRQQGVEKHEAEKGASVQQIQPERASIAPHESGSGNQSADRAAPILHHDADPRVIEREIAQEEQEAEHGVASEPDEE